ncbi:MAG: hypothetical protein KatS3mg087_1803 [Patescibacteria group bacterium]|nr:MAG: hypothetical protein KatS3mg087_1803 [Patescibacteria group bacterium]
MARNNDVVIRTGIDNSDFNRSLRQYLSSINMMMSETQSVMRRVSAYSQIASTGVGVALGTTAVRAVEVFAQQIGQSGKAILENIKFFEALQFSIETTIALTKRQADSTLTMADALAEASKEAESYLLFLQDLAIFSPFTTEEIGRANRTLQIYGILSDQAAGLTRLIVDLASVGGFGAERLQRIALATGQIFAEGRLLARDALQLTQAGVPILNFIQETTGKNVGEIQQLMRKGLLPASLAFEALVQGLSNFEGAGRRVAKTWQGLTSSLEDIAQITSRDIFKGVFEGFRDFAQRLVDIGSSTDFRAAITALGQVIGEQIGISISKAESVVRKFVGSIGKLSPELVTFISVAGSTAAAIGGIVIALGLLRFAVTTLLNPFTLVTAALSSFLGLWVVGQQRIQFGADQISKSASSAISSLISAITPVKEVPDVISDAINFAAREISRAGEIMVRVLSGVVRTADSASVYIGNLASALVDWGNALIESFASGIGQATDGVLGALRSVGSVIEFFLKPGSPPRLLPDIDLWGKQTAEEWLKGWSDADFDALDSIFNAVRSELRGVGRTWTTG